MHSIIGDRQDAPLELSGTALEMSHYAVAEIRTRSAAQLERALSQIPHSSSVFWEPSLHPRGRGAYLTRELHRFSPPEGCSALRVIVASRGDVSDLVITGLRRRLSYVVFRDVVASVAQEVQMQRLDRRCFDRQHHPARRGMARRSISWGCASGSEQGVIWVQCRSEGGLHADMRQAGATAAEVLTRYTGAKTGVVGAMTIDKVREVTRCLSWNGADESFGSVSNLPATMVNAGNCPEVGVICVNSDLAGTYMLGGGSPFALTLEFHCVEPGQCDVLWRFRDDEINPVVAEEFVGQVIGALRGSSAPMRSRAGTPDGAISRSPLPNEAQADFPGDASKAAVRDRTLMDLLHEVTLAHPESVAVKDQFAAMTYREIWRSMEAVAGGLKFHGVEPGDLVAVGLFPSAWAIAVLGGILLAGATYVPVDMRSGINRARRIIRRCGAKLCVVGEKQDEVPGIANVTLQELRDDAARGVASDHPSDLETVELSGPEGVAYVIYTSGTTGEPKGVKISQRNVVSLIDACRALFSIASSDRWSLYHSLAFDFSVWEMWGCLLSGGCLCVVPESVRPDPDTLAEWIKRERISVLSLTPTALKMLLMSRSLSAGSLQWLILGGEALEVEDVRRWFRVIPYSECNIVNMYGITETTVHVTAEILRPDTLGGPICKIGKPLPGWTVTVRGRDGKDAPFGTVGELYVGGAGVAQGYIGDRQLTAERFVKAAVAGQGVMYKTGDFVRMWPDGSLEFVGRTDEQVEIRGHRVELAEVRAALLRLPGVIDAVVVAEPSAGEAVAAQLRAFVVGWEPGRSFRTQLQADLPDYLIPAVVAAVEIIPTTPNGKIDLARLKDLATDKTIQAEFAEGMPGDLNDGIGSLTHAILRAWQETFQRGIALTDDFFDLGGNSLLAVKLLRRLQAAGFESLSVRDIYEASSPGGLASLLSVKASTK